jgi:hypothetical protein
MALATSAMSNPRATGATTSTGRTSSRFCEYRYRTPYAAKRNGWSGTRLR